MTHSMAASRIASLRQNVTCRIERSPCRAFEHTGYHEHRCSRVLAALISLPACRGLHGASAVRQSSTCPRLRPSFTKMTARFAPADIGADVAGAAGRTSARRWRELVEAARIMDASSCGRSGPATTRCCRISRVRRVAGGPRSVAPRGSAPALLPDQQRPVVAARSQPSRSCPARRPKPEGANFYPAGATKAEIQKWIDSLTGDAKDARDRLLHDDPPRRRRQLHRPCPTASSIRASWRARPRCSARPRR